MTALYVNQKIDETPLSEDALIAFFHGQRTGGSALRHILARGIGTDKVFATQYAGEFEHWHKIKPETLLGLRVFAGHSNYSQVDLGREQRYISLVRHPVYRVFSIFYYCKRYDTHALHPFTNNATMAEFYESARKRSPSYFDNVQCRRISGEMKIGPAMKALEDHMWAIGATEKLNNFTDWLLPKLGAEKEDVPDLGSDAEKYAKELKNTDLVERILNDNREDLQLFEYLNASYFGMPADLYPRL